MQKHDLIHYVDDDNNSTIAVTCLSFIMECIKWMHNGFWANCSIFFHRTCRIHTHARVNSLEILMQSHKIFEKTFVLCSKPAQDKVFLILFLILLLFPFFFVDESNSNCKIKPIYSQKNLLSRQNSRPTLLGLFGGSNTRL